MALGTNNTTAAIAGNFIPELWSDEVVGAYKSNLVVANLVTKLSHKGKKGDTIYIPVPERGSASVKAAGNQVTLSAATNDKVTVSINKHYEYSKLIEDIAEVQALASFRKFYTDDAGYALAKQVDSDLFTLAETFAKTGVGVVGGTGTAMYEKAVIGSNGTTLYTGNSSNASAIPPVASSTMLGLNRFTEQQFIGNGDAIKTGKIGMIYGMDIFVSTNCPTATSTDRVGMIMHKDALVLAEQVGVRSQTSYKQEWLADLFTSDTIYGYQTLRHDAGVAFVVPA